MKSVSLKFAVSMFFLITGIAVRDLTSEAVDSSATVFDEPAAETLPQAKFRSCLYWILPQHGWADQCSAGKDLVNLHNHLSRGART